MKKVSEGEGTHIIIELAATWALQSGMWSWPHCKIRHPGVQMVLSFAVACTISQRRTALHRHLDWKQSLRLLVLQWSRAQYPVALFDSDVSEAPPEVQCV